MEITRRSYLKGNLAVLAAATLSGAFGVTGCSSGSDEEETDASWKRSEGEWKRGYCNCCVFENCGIEVNVVDGIAVEVRGLASHPINKGTMCPRGAAVLASTYNPYRVKAPLKRTNSNKGLAVDPKFVEISWDEAMSTVSQQLTGLNPKQFAHMTGFSANPLSRPLVAYTNVMMGSPNMLLSNGPLCEIHYGPNRFFANHMDKPDLEYCNYLVSVGRSVGGTVMYAAGHSRALAKAIERGMELVVVDPRATAESSKGEWVPIRPGADLAFLMGMAHVILHEEKIYDTASLKKRSNAPYLVYETGPDAGDYIRDASGKPMMWDLSSGTAKAFDDATLVDPALEGSYTVNSTQVTTGFALLKESVRLTTPEWQVDKSTVSAAKVREITKNFLAHANIGATKVIDGVTLPYRPAAVAISRGSAQSSQGRPAHYLAEVINVLIGGIGVPGNIIAVSSQKHFETTGPANSDGVFAIADEYQRNDPKKVAAAFATATSTGKFLEPDILCRAFFPIQIRGFGTLGTAFRAIASPTRYNIADDAHIKVLWAYGTNAIQSYTDPEVFEAGFKSIPFVYTNALHLDEVAVMCDIVMPDSGHLERSLLRSINNITGGNSETIAMYDNYNGMKAVIAPLYKSRQTDAVNLELLTKAGKTQMVNTMWSVGYSLPVGQVLPPTKAYTYDELLEITANYKLKGANGSKGAMDWFAENVFFNQYPNRTIASCYDITSQGTARLPLYDQSHLAIGRTLKNEITTRGLTMPDWESSMDVVYNEYTAVPGWKENFITNPEKFGFGTDFDLYVINWKTTWRNQGNGGHDYNPWLKEVISDWVIDDFCIQMHPETAYAKGLQNGDKIRVTSQHGRYSDGTLKVTNLIHPDAIGFPGQAGAVSPFVNPVARKGSNYNRLLTSKGPYLVPDSGMLYNTARVKVQKIS